MLTVLDPYIALALCLSAAAYRWLSSHPEPDAFPIMALLVALSLSTYAQCLFGLDGSSGLTRYRLLPLRGWEILLAKDIAYLGDPLGAGSAARSFAGNHVRIGGAGIGHHPSVLQNIPQRRWRFTGGTLFPAGIMQAIGGTALGFAERNSGVWFLLLAVLIYGASLFAYGLVWDHANTAA